LKYKFLLAGIFLFSSFTVEDLAVSTGQEANPISWNIKPPVPIWEMGDQKNKTTNTESLKQSNWYSNAMKSIAASEYHFKWEEKLNAYCTPNRKNNLRFFYDEDGFTVEPRTTQIPIGDYDPMKRPDEIKYKHLSSWKISFNLDKKQVGNGKWQIVNNKAEYITDNITIQYINNESGMRQNFIVQKPLSKKEELKINFSIKTKLKYKLSGNQLQFFNNKIHVLNYEDLKVWDAEGRNLAASFHKKADGKYLIRVDTKDARYPVTIDPISTTPASVLESNQAGASFGLSVASAGDLNGDGYSDVIVGAYQYDNGQTDEGAAFIYHGSSTGINTTAAAFLESNQASSFFGGTVAGAGDVNGDGYSDVIIGAGGYDNGQTDEGAAFVYHGSSTGVNTTIAAFLESNQASAVFGSVAGAGDVNGDGNSDVIVGARGYDNGQTDEGVAFIYHGSVTGVNTTVAAIVESNNAFASMGRSVASAGDVNGDGYSDIIVGAHNYLVVGAAFIYHGSASGINTTIAATITTGQLNGFLGFSVASAGDVNGDGYSDVIVGAWAYDNGQADEGVAFIHHGSASGINSTPVATLETNQTGAEMGYSVACAGDINADGYSDVIVGAGRYDNGQTDEGAAFVYQGAASGINITAIAVLEMNQANALLGTSVASAGDVNGDGYSDVVVGAYQYDNGQTDEGAAFVYHGASSGISTTPATTVESNQANTIFGISLSGAGDVNGDGYSDIIVGAPWYDNGQTDEGVAFIFHGSGTGINTGVAAMVESNQAGSGFGRGVSCAGDVNGDGYSDVIVGAFNFDNGQTDEGAAFIYQGSATGINVTAAAMVESNQANAYMGFSVAGAGDVNGDGYSDLIVGAYLFDNGQADEGVAFIYRGSSTGVNTVPAATLECNQANAYFGLAVAGGGDINGDGYCEVIVSAYLYDSGQTDEGAVFVFNGSSTGINTTAATRVESNQANSRFGWSCNTAGDVNGDGYSDVIVGAWAYDNGQTNEGAIYYYLGSGTGISITATGIYESNQADGEFGISVASAGDVNGDGYCDIVAGAYMFDNGQTDEGIAFVYLGSSGGINGGSVVTLESNQSGSRFGGCVAGAGDVNGDGYSDVIVGAYFYDNGQIDEGAAFVYHGNSPGTNKRNNLRLYNTNLSTPINSSNFIFGNFGAGLFAKSFLGKAKGKLVWETRLNYNAYSGTPITNSTFFTDQQSVYTDMGLTGVELKNLINKILGGRYTKLRARVKYDPVTAITGQVYSPWRNVSSIIDANNLGILPIELISFNAAWLQKGKTAKLEFKTDKESGICCFDIEKSNDGFSFYKIGTLPAKNSTGIQSYSFIDGNATSKKQFYRLKIKGIAGQVDYSNIQQLQHNGATEILVFPNPTTNVLQLQLSKVYDKMNVQVVNAAGQVVKQFTLPASNQTITIPVNNLPAGQYWLRLQGGGEKQVLQFVKQ